ncbi:MAG: DNA polymerase III subunit beta [Patescibacteria group bacterium]|nr:DNA polymerase III subunit beta [Patescibacteria group bacterium]
MKINKSIFLEKINLASKFINQRISSSNILQGIFLKKENNILYFYSTNLNFYYKGEIKIKNKEEEKDFYFVIEPKKIIEFLSLISQEEIDFLIKEKTIIISSEKNKGEFSIIKTDEFPIIKIDKNLKQEKINIKNLKQAFPLVCFASSNDESRPVLTGINFDTVDETTQIVATDGFRLSLYSFDVKFPISSAIIPSVFFNEVLKVSENKEEIDFYFNEKDKVFTFCIDTDQFSTRIIEGEYPPYERVIPKQKTTEVIVDREDFLRNIKLASIFAREFSNIVLFDVEKNLIKIIPKTGGKNENISTQEAEVKGEPIKIAFNSKFLIDFLTKTNSEKIKIEFLRQDSPTVFKIVGNDNFLHIIMPVRIQE